MRKLAFFTLGMYISIIMSSFVFAASSVPVSKSCSTSAELSIEELTASKNGSISKDQSKSISEKYSSYEESIPVEADKCGDELKPNSKTNSYEMGDCAEAEKIVTEITEAIGSETTTSDGQIINLYKGLCCSSGDTIDGTYYCDATRNVYFDTYSDCNSAAQSCQKVQWLISGSGMGILKTYVKQIYVFGAGIVGFIAVATIVGSGIQISISGATGDITAAKDRITQSIMGIALLFLSALILYTINPTFFY